MLFESSDRSVIGLLFLLSFICRFDAFKFIPRGIQRISCEKVTRYDPNRYRLRYQEVDTFVDQRLGTPEFERPKVGVLLLNLGGPETTEDVEGFLFNLFADPDIIRLPSFLSVLQKPIAYFIAKRRAPKSSEAYRSIGGGSPIVKYTQAQADLIEDLLRQKGPGDMDFKCYFAMRYWNPYTEEVLDKMQRDGVNTVVIVPLYPQYSISTSGSSLRLLQDIFYKQPEKWGPNKVSHTVVPAWYYRDGYVKTMATLIIKELEAYSVDEMKKGVHVLFSAHGVPESYIEAGDPYKRQIEECVRLISKEVSRQLSSTDYNSPSRPSSIAPQVAAALGATDASYASRDGINPVQFHLSFQSRVGPVQWLK
jgi:protoporphyrin/coproporphyrin ferrochelatase